MKNRKIKDIVEELRAAANAESQDYSALQKKNLEMASELETILMKDKSDNKFMGAFIVLILLFLFAVNAITMMSNDNLQDDVTQKKELLTKFEQAVKNDSVSVYSDGKKLTIPELLDDNLKLMNKLNELEIKVSRYEMQLNMIKKQYGIKIVYDKDLYYLEGKEVDSALMLLHVFRDRIKYDSINQQWDVTSRIVTIGDKTIKE